MTEEQLHIRRFVQKHVGKLAPRLDCRVDPTLQTKAPELTVECVYKLKWKKNFSQAWVNHNFPS